MCQMEASSFKNGVAKSWRAAVAYRAKEGVSGETRRSISGVREIGGETSNLPSYTLLIQL